MRLGEDKEGMKKADIIREMTTRDLPTVRDLLRQLGYDLDEGELVRRFKMVDAAESHHLLVASNGDEVLAFVHVFYRPALEKPPEAVVQALVVDERARGAGIGRRLMDAAEEWAGGLDFESIVLTSGTAREEAHAFYRTLGYDTIAPTFLLRKRL